jgi:hypothetical protein
MRGTFLLLTCHFAVWPSAAGCARLQVDSDSVDTNDSGDTGPDTADSGDTGDTGDTADTGDTSDTADSGDTADTADSGDTGDPLPRACFPSPAVICPSGTPDLGVRGGFDEEGVELRWQYSRECDFSYTPALYRKVGPDLVGLAVTADMGSELTGIGYLAFDRRILLDVEAEGATAWYEAPFKHGLASTATIALPNSPSTRPGGTCLAVVAVAEGDRRGESVGLWLTSRRESVGRTLDLNFVVASGTRISESDLGEVFDETAAFLADVGVTVGDGWLYEAEVASPYVELYGADIEALRTFLPDSDPNALNVFVVQDFLEAGYYGIAGGVPGPLTLGTVNSGVVVSVDTHLLGDGRTLDTREMGSTVAHELGHQIGLFHTTEADGSDHDPLSDTPQCPPSRDRDRDGYLGGDECADLDGRYVMFWTGGSVLPDRWSAQQKDVFGRSAVLVP